MFLRIFGFGLVCAAVVLGGCETDNASKQGTYVMSDLPDGGENAKKADRFNKGVHDDHGTHAGEDHEGHVHEGEQVDDGLHKGEEKQVDALEEKAEVTTATVTPDAATSAVVE